MTAMLQRFANIRRDEAGPTLVAGLFFFCVLTALMVVRPAREALGMQRGIEAIRWLFIGTVLVTLAGQSDVRLARQPVPAPRFHQRDLSAFSPSALWLLHACSCWRRQRRGADRPGLLRLVQRLQPVRHDALLGADGRPLHARAEQAPVRRRSRWAERWARSRPLAGERARQPLGTPALLLVAAVFLCSRSARPGGLPSPDGSARADPEHRACTGDDRARGDRRQRLGGASGGRSGRPTCSAIAATC